eukprot:361525-Chlamydomonas_euryale.AAC.16
MLSGQHMFLLASDYAVVWSLHGRAVQSMSSFQHLALYKLQFTKVLFNDVLNSQRNTYIRASVPMAANDIKHVERCVLYFLTRLSRKRSRRD